MKKDPKIKTLLGLNEEELLLKESPNRRQQKKNDKKAAEKAKKDAEEKAKKDAEESSTKTVTEKPEEKPVEEQPSESKEKPAEEPTPSKSKEDEINDRLDGFISNMVLSAWNFEENKGKTEILIKALKRILNLANSLRKLEVKATAEEVENEKAE